MTTFTPDYADLEEFPEENPNLGLEVYENETEQGLAEEETEGQDPASLTEEQWARVISIVNKLDLEDKPERDKWLPIWKKLEYLWAGWQKLTWEPGEGWRSSYDLLQSGELSNLQPEDIYRVVNVYRSHGESIVAALSAALPNVRFFPDDADSAEDITTSRACSKINEKIDIENESPLTFVHALFILFNQSFVAFYNYYVEDEKYGKAKIPQYGMEEQEEYHQFCPSCGYEGEGDICPECSSPLDVEARSESIPVIHGYDEVDKGCEVIEAWGPLNLKILHGIKDQKDTPYALLETDCHETILKSIYPGIREKLKSSAPQTPDKFDRTNNYNPSLHTVGRAWLRPCNFEDEENADLLELFPDGGYFVIIDKMVGAESLPEKFDSHWTIPVNPLARFLHADPMGMQLSHIQDMINELVDLTMQNIEQGITQVFADPRVLDFTQYGSAEIKPGTVFPAKPQSGKSLGESFHEFKAATPGQGEERFRASLDQYAQLVSGSTPSIYGGQLTGGSQTYKEYEASKNQALQRLSLTWRMLNLAWAKVKEKSVTSYRKNLIEDEKFVKKFGNSFVSVHIKKAELQGKIGRVTAEVTDQLPVSWSQKRGTVMELIQMQLPQLIATFFHPENVTMMKDLFGLSDLHIPGEDDRIRQLFDIQAMLESGPNRIPPPMDEFTGEVMMDPISGAPLQETVQSTIPPNPALDDNNIRIEVLRAWLLSEVGEDAKIVNPEGYENVMAQLNERVQLQMMQAAPAVGPDGQPLEGEETAPTDEMQ